MYLLQLKSLEKSHYRTPVLHNQMAAWNRQPGLPPSISSRINEITCSYDNVTSYYLQILQPLLSLSLSHFLEGKVGYLIGHQLGKTWSDNSTSTCINNNKESCIHDCEFLTLCTFTVRLWVHKLANTGLPGWLWDKMLWYTMMPLPIMQIIWSRWSTNPMQQSRCARSCSASPVSADMVSNLLLHCCMSLLSYYIILQQIV